MQLVWKAQRWISELKSKVRFDSILPINDTNAPCERILRPHLEKFHERSARSADNELRWRAPSVINIVSMHRSIITIRSNTRRPRAMPDASLGYHSRLLLRKGCPPPRNSTWGCTTFIPPYPRSLDLEHATSRSGTLSCPIPYAIQQRSRTFRRG